VPKKKNHRKPARSAYVAQTESTSSALKKRVIKWASITVILAILLSVMIAAISASPASAADATPSAACVIPDTDGDAITNDVDSDIDGDEIVNGLDDDIDGDDIVNAKDSDPATTLCNDSGVLPMLPSNPDDQANDSWVRWVGAGVFAILGVGYIVLRRIRGAKK
jgi:hypothetical protein